MLYLTLLSYQGMRIPGGAPLEAIEELMDEIEVPSFLAHKTDLFGLKVIGDSMSKVVPDGAIAVLQKCYELHNGEVGAVLIDQNDATLKRFYRLKDYIVLEPDSYNAEYQPILLHEGEHEATIIGKLVWYCAPKL